MDRKYLELLGITNFLYSDIKETYLNELNKYKNIEEIDNLLENQKYINKNIFIRITNIIIKTIINLDYSAPELFYAIDLFKFYNHYNKNIPIEEYELTAISAIINAIKIENNDKFNNNIYNKLSKEFLEYYSVKKMKINSEFYLSLMQKNGINNIITIWNYLHFFNEIIWKKYDFLDICNKYQEMFYIAIQISKEPYIYNPEYIAYSIIKSVFNNLNINLKIKEYFNEYIKLKLGKKIKISIEFLRPPIFIDKVPIIYFPKRKKIKGYITPNKIFKFIDNLKTNFIPLFKTDNYLICRELINYNNITIIGKGIQGTVFILNGINNLVIKRTIIENIDYLIINNYKGKILTTKALHEIIIDTIFTQLYIGINGNFNKNFPFYDGFYICPYIQEKYYSFIVMERCNLTLKNLFSTCQSYKLVKGIIFQILFAIKTIQFLFKAIHNDLHLDNILLQKNNKNLYYKFGKNIWYLPELEYIIKLTDFGLTSIFIEPNILLNEIFIGNYKKSNIIDIYLPGYDIIFVLYTIIYELPLEDNKIKNLLNILCSQIYDIYEQNYNINIKPIKGDFITNFSYNFINKFNRPNIEVSKLDLTKLLYNSVFDEYKEKKLDSYEMAKIIDF